MRSLIFAAAFCFAFQLATCASWAQYPLQFYAPGTNSQGTWYSTAGYGDYVFGPRVLVIEDYGGYRPYYYGGYRVRPVYRVRRGW